MFLLLLLACPALQAPVGPAPVPWPATKRDVVTDTLFGEQISDPYRWLEDEKSPEVQSWVDEQDGYTRRYLGAIPGRTALSDRFRELYFVDQVGTPVMTDSRLFYGHQFPDKNKSMLVYREAGAAETVLLDPNGWSTDGTVSLGDWYPTEDGSKVAYQRNENNSDEAVLHVIDVATGEVSKVDVIVGAKYASVSWTRDGKGFYYEWLPTDPSIPEDQRPGYTEVRYHALGTDPAKDPIIHPALKDPTSFLESSLSFDGRYLLIYRFHGWTATDVYFKDLGAPGAAPLTGPTEFQPLVVGNKALYSVIPWQDQFYIATDDGAPRSRILVADPKNPAREAWKELIAEQPNATLEGFDIVGGHLVLAYLRDVASVLKVHSLDGKELRELPLPTIGTASLPSGQPDQDQAWFSFSTFSQPREVYQTSIRDGGSTVWAKVNIPADTSKYQVDQVFYTSKDRKKIPMFLVHRKDVTPNGNVPTLLYGYGGFEVSLTPTFRSSILPWLDMGGVYAVANIRGGGEYGKEWHEAGMRFNKQNVFDDFILAVEHLISSGWTRSERLAIYGGSNGGLLVGAVMTQRPDLWGAVICGVPLLDMLRYHLFGSGRTWVEEYGSAENEAEFRNILAWSPYQRVKEATSYPSLLMMASDHDDRVDPLHARKFVAAMQHAQLDPAVPMLLRVERNAGHGGSDNVSKSVESSADMYAFLKERLGVR